MAGDSHGPRDPAGGLDLDGVPLAVANGQGIAAQSRPSLASARVVAESSPPLKSTTACGFSAVIGFLSSLEEEASNPWPSYACKT